MAIIIKSNVTMTSPGDAPYVPDLETGLYIDIDAASLDYSDGATAASIIAGGAASLVDRSFVYTTRSAPVFYTTGGHNGGRYLQFSGAHSLSNCASISDPRTIVSQPLTFGFMVRIDDWVANLSHAGILRGQSVNHLLTVCPNSVVGRFCVDAGAAVNAVDTSADGSWGAIVIVFDGANSLIYTRGNTVTFNAGAMSYAGIAFGGNSTTNPGAKFGLSKFRMYNRRLSSAEIVALSEYIGE